MLHWRVVPPHPAASQQLKALDLCWPSADYRSETSTDSGFWLCWRSGSPPARARLPSILKARPRVCLCTFGSALAQIPHAGYLIRFLSPTSPLSPGPPCYVSSENALTLMLPAGNIRSPSPPDTPCSLAVTLLVPVVFEGEPSLLPTAPTTQVPTRVSWCLELELLTVSATSLDRVRVKGQSGRVNNSSHSGAVSRTIRETPVDLSHERDSHDLSREQAC